MSKPNNCFIALHIGAGYHSQLKEREYQNLCNEACDIGMNLLRNGESCVDAVEKVCSLLEDSSLTNAGYGSNLSLNGLVECDAGIMESSGSTFGAVTCVKEVKNPIKLAKILSEEQLLPGKLIPPIVLAGDGAKAKAVSCGLELVTNAELTSPQAMSDHCRYKRILEDANDSISKRIKLDDSISSDNNDDEHSTSSVDKNNVTFTDDSICSTDDMTPAKCKENIDDSTCNTCNTTEIKERNHFSNKNVNGEISYHNDELDEHCYCKNLSENETSGVVLNISSDNDHCYNKVVNEKLCEKKDFSIPKQIDDSSVPCTLQTIDEKKKFKKSKLHDTIGVICVDNKLNVASGVSSGGIVLKQPGRVSHAAHYGCGCWAFRYSEDLSIGCCTSGCGELLIRTGLAKKAAEHSLRKTDKVLNYNEFLEKKFLNSPYIEGVKGQRFCGLLVVKLFKEDSCSDKHFVDFHLAHTSESFCVSFMSGNMKKSQFILSRLKKDEAGNKVMSQGFTLRL